MPKLSIVLLLALALPAALSTFTIAHATARSSGNRPIIAAAVSTTAPRLLGSYVREQDVPAWCAQEKQYGVRFTWLAIPWYAVEPSQGTVRWNVVDPLITAAQACGMDVGVHILARSTWATLAQPDDSPPGTLVSMPPKVMSDYYDFVYRLATHYRGVVSRYSIENEAHASINWPSSPESYFEMLATGYQAVHAADPSALVEDAGLSSAAFAVLVANDLLQAGNTQTAVDYWTSYFSVFDKSLKAINSAAGLQALLAQPEIQRTLQWSDLLYDHAAYFDIQQLHYFAPWNDLTRVTDWVHGRLAAHGGDKPLDFWETGYGWDDPSTLDLETQARDQIKLYATAMGEGGLRVVQFEFNDGAASIGHPGLVTSAGPQPPAQTFQLLAQKLNGSTGARRLDLGSSAWGYEFDTPTGTVAVVWSDAVRIVSVPFDSHRVDVTSLAGARTTTSPSSVSLSTSPVVVQAAVNSNFIYLPMLIKP